VEECGGGGMEKGDVWVAGRRKGGGGMERNVVWVTGEKGVLEGFKLCGE